MSMRKLITISLSPALLRQAEVVAKEEHRTKSELLREALRFYVETKAIRRTAVRERLFEVLDRVQARTQGASPGEIRKAIQQSIAAVRRESRRASA
jgi:Arc/MetJ-type ribon-helix-helix transcriptional regulator